MLLAGAGLSGLAVAQQPISGRKPSYLEKPVSSVPNEQAIVKRRWAPGLDEGYTPQGLSVSGGRVYIVGYGADGCRLFRMESDVRGGSMHLPACKHGGGLAAIGGDRLVVIDTRALFIVQNGTVERMIRLAEPLRGSFGDFDGTDLWIGSYERSNPGRIWRIPLAKLAGDSLTETDAAQHFAIPEKAQGMAFGAGGIWLTFSGSTFGQLAKFDRRTGRQIAKYPMPAGIEDIGFDSVGLLWAVSEAGAKRYVRWGTTFPLVFALDIARLRP
ncbi:MAG TPA: hypothetical protein PKW21_10125 [Rhabdaerophilum sp.]|nr:hypothetical protein [Rhabdaerophilum sp.]